MKERIKNLLVLFILMQPFAILAQTRVDISRGFALENNQVRFAFEQENMGLSSMKDFSSGVEHINAVDGRHLLWEVVFAKGQQIYTITNNYKPCSYATVETLPDGSRRAVMEWNRMRWWEEDDAISVTVIVDLPKDEGIAQWRIFVENNSDFWGIWSVLFPIVNGFPESGKYDIARPAQGRGGEFIHNCVQKQRGRYPGSEWPIQMVSFDNGGNSVYLATMDTEARAKDFVLEPVKGINSLRYPVIYYGRRHRRFDPEPGERIYIEHYTDDMGIQGSDYPDHYPIAFGVHKGGWTKAARIYRSWAIKQKWTGKGTLSNRIDLPASAVNLGLWINDDMGWNPETGSQRQGNKELLAAAKEMNVPMALHWRNYYTKGSDLLDPAQYNAPEGFVERIKILGEQNIIVIPYMDGTGVQLNQGDFDKFEAHAVKDEAGGFRFYPNSTGERQLVAMCASQAQWQDLMEKKLDHIQEKYGVAGIFIGQVSGLAHENCFDTSHLHPLGGGSHWTDGSRELLVKLKNVALKNGRNSMVTTDGANEVLLDCLDATLLSAHPSGSEIPMLQMIYSGYAIFFGSVCDYSQSNDYFRYAQGQAFIDGRQNGWMDLGLFNPEYKEKVAYLKQCATYRTKIPEYLVYGQLLDPVFPVQSIERFSENVCESGSSGEVSSAILPAAEARLWKSEEGNLAVLFANYVDKEIRFSYRIDPGDYGLPQGTWKIRETGTASSKNSGEFTTILNRTEILEPGTIKVIELIPRQD